MGIISNIKQNMKQNQDRKIIEQIKNESNPEEIWNLIQRLQLDDSRMQIFKIFDESHVFDRFKNKKYDEIENPIENPYEIFVTLENDRDKFTVIKYFYENGIDNYGLCSCIRDTSDNCRLSLLKSVKTQEYKEKVLDIIFSSINFDGYDIEELVLTIIDNMEPERREQFLQNHDFNNRMLIKLYSRYNDESIIQKSDESMKEYFSDDDNYDTIWGINKKGARRLLELYGDNMCPMNLGCCIESSYDNIEDLENMLNRYYTTIKSEIDSIFTGVTLYSYDFKMIEMFIKNFSKDIDERGLEKVLKNYNECFEEKTKIKNEKYKEDKIKDFLQHDKENPRFLYDIVCQYYDIRTQDEEFKPTFINEVIESLPLIDRLEFVRRYKSTIEILEVRGISEEVLAYGADNLDIKEFLIEYQDIISAQDIIDIINSLPFKQRAELIKICNLDEEQKKQIIEHAQENGDRNISFLELIATRAELEKDRVETQKNINQQSEISSDTEMPTVSDADRSE